jgi:hypothetical protein
MNGRKGEAIAEAYSIHVTCTSSCLQKRVTQKQLKWNPVGFKNYKLYTQQTRPVI